MDEPMRFVARLLDGDKMAGLCEEFGISRKTGYKVYDRYKDAGLVGLTDRSRRPHRHANQLPMAVEKLIVRLKKEYRSGGAPKLQERLTVRWPEVACPAISTVHAVLDRHGLVRRRRRRLRPRLTGTRLTQPSAPNALWCADYKGEFLLGNRRRNQVAVNGHQIALSDEPLKLDAQIWVLASDPFHKANERLRASPAMGLCWRYDDPTYRFTARALAG
jgi:putative transposase